MPIKPEPSDETRRALAKPFPDAKVKQKPGQGGRLMAYISHGLVTERLNEVDPGWSWRVLQTFTYTKDEKDKQGQIAERVHCEGVLIEMTVGGVTRVEAGGPQRQDGFANELKNALSDALKRGAMRFGVALSMWESLIDAEQDEDVHPGGVVATEFKEQIERASNLDTLHAIGAAIKAEGIDDPVLRATWQRKRQIIEGALRSA